MMTTSEARPYHGYAMLYTGVALWRVKPSVSVVLAPRHWPRSVWKDCACNNPPTFTVFIHCGCGLTHKSIEAWRACPMALVPVPVKVWWREPPLISS